jgi:hypothetical protein
MNRDEQLTLIRQKCIKANPEITRVIATDTTVLLGCSNCANDWYCTSAEELNAALQHKGRIGRTFCSKKFMHLGHGRLRPIRLADVLVAIDKRKSYGEYATIASNGWFHFDAERSWWNLRKNDLTEQSEECILFLYDLLK